VLDRLIQQAVAQVLSPVFDPGFVRSRMGSGRAKAPTMR
jgi:retron-type reverse transcriptase